MNENTLRLEFLHSNVDLNVLDENLKPHLKNFVVKDAQGKPVGELQDLYRAPNEQLYLVVSARETDKGSCSFLLNSKLVHKVDAIAQAVFVILSAAQIEQLLEYLSSKMEDVKLSKHLTVPGKDEAWLVSTMPVAISQPIPQDKLIVEPSSPESRQFAEMDLAEEAIADVELNTPLNVNGEFTSAEAASRILHAIARRGRHKGVKVRVELVVDTPQLQEIYQQCFLRYAGC